MKQLTPAVFLDRDGVISSTIVRDGRPYAPRLAEFRILPEAGPALKRLKKAGFLLIVATNQPDVARGEIPRDELAEMHRRLMAELPLDDIEACVAEDGPDCDCYKPKPGMLLKAATRHGIDLPKSFMIGDRWRDVGAGKAAGCRTVFIDYGYREACPERPDFSVGSLTEAVDILLRNI
jgi:D-glycero-D-manno-heptose 1,7-bisphosphate phosphatase